MTPNRFGWQVRFAYVGLMVLSLGPLMGFINAFQLVGTGLLVGVGYCILAHSLVLFPIERKTRLTCQHVHRVVLLRATTVALIETLEHN